MSSSDLKLFVGSNPVDAVRIGSSVVDAVYYGSTRVF